MKSLHKKKKIKNYQKKLKIKEEFKKKIYKEKNMLIYKNFKNIKTLLVNLFKIIKYYI